MHKFGTMGHESSERSDHYPTALHTPATAASRGRTDPGTDALAHAPLPNSLPADASSTHPASTNATASQSGSTTARRSAATPAPPAATPAKPPTPPGGYESTSCPGSRTDAAHGGKPLPTGHRTP